MAASIGISVGLTTPTDSVPVSTTTLPSSTITTTPTTSSTAATTSAPPSEAVRTSTSTTPAFTPTTQITVVTAVQTLTVSGSVITSSSVRSSSIVTSASAGQSLNGGGSSGLSSGAKAGVIAGSVVGGVAVLAFVGFLVFCCIKRRRNTYTPGEDEIRWPAQDTDAAELYPAAAQSTGGHGMLERGDSLRSANGQSAYSGQSFGAVGAAGVGAGAAGAFAPHHQQYAQAPSTYWGGSTAEHSAAAPYGEYSAPYGGEHYPETSEAAYSQRPLSASEYGAPSSAAAGLDRNGSIADSAWRGRETGSLHVANPSRY